MSKQTVKDMAAIREEMAVLTNKAIVSDLIEKNRRLEGELLMAQAKYLSLARLVVEWQSEKDSGAGLTAFIKLVSQAKSLAKMPESEW